MVAAGLASPSHVSSNEPTPEQQIIERWKALKDAESEAEVASTFASFLFEKLTGNFALSKREVGIQQSGKPILRPDILIYRDESASTPALTVELKRRAPELNQAADSEFEQLASSHGLYREAVGLPAGNCNGIVQYLNPETVKPEFLAPYGVVLSGDFFQLWRRVEGLVFPATSVQRINEITIPRVFDQLKACIQSPVKGLSLMTWNQKGGVAKTTNTINFAGTLALRGKKVVVLDIDPQNNLTDNLGASSENGVQYIQPLQNALALRQYSEAYSILNQAIQTQSFSTSTNREFSISVLTANAESLRRFRDSQSLRQQVNFFRNLTTILRRKYDYIFADAAPTGDGLAISYLYACDALLMPVGMNKPSVRHAIELHNETLPKMRRARLNLSPSLIGPYNLGVVFTNYSTAAQDTKATLIHELKDCFPDVEKRFELRQNSYAIVTSDELSSKPSIWRQDSKFAHLFDELTDKIFFKHHPINS